MNRFPIDTTTIVWLTVLAVATFLVAGLAIRRGRPAGALLAIGVASEIVYLFVFTGAYPLPALFPRATNFGQVEGLARAAFAGYVFALVLLFAGSAAAVWLARRGTPRTIRRILYGGAAIFGLTLVPLYPFTAIDVFYYVIIGRVWGLHGANPFLVPPSAFPGDSFLHLAEQWVHSPSLYGPVWIYFSLPAAWLAAASFPAAVVFFKLVGLAAHLLGGWLIERLVRPGGESVALAAAAFWLWNPLVLHEGIGEAHNDIVLAALLLLGMWAAGRRPFLGAVPLGAATLLKVTSLPLVPLVLRNDVWLAGRRGKPAAAVATIAVIVGLWVLAYLPFWAGPATFAFLDRLDFFAQSIPALLILWLQEWRVGFPVEPVVKYGTIGLYALIYLWLLARPSRTLADLAGRWFEALFWYLVVAVAYYHNWYLIPLVGLAAFNRKGWRRARAWTLTLSGQIGLATSYFVWHWFGWGFLQAYSLTVPIYFVPALLVTAIGFAYDLWNSRRAGGELGAVSGVATPSVSES